MIYVAYDSNFKNTYDLQVIKKNHGTVSDTGDITSLQFQSLNVKLLDFGYWSPWTFIILNDDGISFNFVCVLHLLYI